MKKNLKKIQLTKTTISILNGIDKKNVHGGIHTKQMSCTCPPSQPCPSQPCTSQPIELCP